MMAVKGEAESCQVLIVGAGPTGMVLAYALARAGLEVRVVESARTYLEDMRASTIHPPTLDMLKQLGLFEDLLAQGIKAPIYQYYNRHSGASYAFDLADIDDCTEHPFRLQCEQFKLVRIIAERLAAMPNVRVDLGTSLLSFEQDDSGVTATVETPMEIKIFRAAYLVGADGANSTTRKWLGTEFEGFTYPEHFLTLSTSYPIEQHLPWLEGVNYVAEPPKWCVVLRVPELWRILVPVRDAESEQSVLSDAQKDAVFRQLLGTEAPQIATRHRTLYRVHQRVATSFHQGRVALIGDAAHLNNPLGGFGMNSGIHDAWNLQNRLLPILLEGASAEPLLAHFSRQRRKITLDFVQAQTKTNKAALEHADSTAQREAQFAMLTRDTDARRAFLLEQSMYASLERERSIG